MSDVVGRKTIDDLEPVVIPESLATIRVPANVDGQTVRLTVQQLSDAIKTDATNKINLNGDNAIFDNLSQAAKDNIALNLSADFNYKINLNGDNAIFDNLSQAAKDNIALNLSADFNSKINLNGDNAILDNLSQEAKDNIALNLSADFYSTPTIIARNVVFEATTNGWLQCYLATLSEYIPIVSQSDDASFTNSITIASNGVPGIDASAATFLVFIPKGKFIKWTGGLDLTVIKFYKCAGK